MQHSSDICEVTPFEWLWSSSLHCCGAAAGRWCPPCGPGFRASLSEGPEVAGLQRTRAPLRRESSAADWSRLTSHRTRPGSARPLALSSEVTEKWKNKHTCLIPRSWIHTFVATSKWNLTGLDHYLCLSTEWLHQTPLAAQWLQMWTTEAN